MSGGSFNHLYLINYEEQLGRIEDVKAMERWLREKGKHDAADELFRYQLELETALRRLTVMYDRLMPLMAAAEKWCSGDYAEEGFNRTSEWFFKSGPGAPKEAE
jgi:hypothetical protein